jgi:anthranilate phosphoribosyltransferase
VRILEKGQLRSDWINPVDLGLQLAPLAELKGGDLSDNQAILQAVLQGRGTRAQQDVVALNTALVLWVAGVEPDLKQGVQQALVCLGEGHPWQRLERLSQALRGGEEE